MTDDAELLRRYAEEGSEAAFAEWVQRHLGLVYGAALNLMRDEQTPAATRAGGPRGRGNFVRGRGRAAGRLGTAASGARRGHGRTGRDGPRGGAAAVFRGAGVWEVGQRLELSENTARMRVERALEKLRAVLARRGVTSTTAALGVVLANQAGAATAVPAGLAGSVTSAAFAGAGKGLGMIGFMSSTKTVMTVGGALLVCALLGLATWEYRQGREARALVAAEQQAGATMEEPIRETDAKWAAAKREAAGWTEALAAAQAARARAEVTEKRATTAKSAERWDPVAEGRGMMEPNPALRRAVLAPADAMTDFNFEPMYRELGLTPAQIEAFRAAMREMVSVSAPFGPQGEQYSFLAGTDVPFTEINRRIEEALGEVNMQRVGGFFRVRDARTTVAQWAGSQAFTETPVTAGQAESLVRIMMETAMPPGRNGKVGQFDWEVILDRAAALLAPCRRWRRSDLVLANPRSPSELREVAGEPPACVGVAVSVAVVVAGAACWFLARENSALATSATTLRGQREGHERELVRAEARLRDQRTEAAKVKATLDAVGTAVGASAVVEHKPPLTMSDLMRRAAAKDEDPTAATRGRASHRSAMALRYAPLFRARGLDARQQEAFKDNLMKRDDQNRDLVDVAKERGYDPNDPAISKLRGEIYLECETAQRALLGAERYAAALDFERTSVLRGMVGNLAGLVAVEGAPLTSTQAEDLIRLLAEASDSYRKGGSARSTSIDWARVRSCPPC